MGRCGEEVVIAQYQYSRGRNLSEPPDFVIDFSLKLSAEIG